MPWRASIVPGSTPCPLIFAKSTHCSTSRNDNLSVQPACSSSGSCWITLGNGCDDRHQWITHTPKSNCKRCYYATKPFMNGSRDYLTSNLKTQKMKSCSCYYNYISSRLNCSIYQSKKCFPLIIARINAFWGVASL